jgi:hypothetical protein
MTDGDDAARRHREMLRRRVDQPAAAAFLRQRRQCYEAAGDCGGWQCSGKPSRPNGARHHYPPENLSVPRDLAIMAADWASSR